LLFFIKIESNLHFKYLKTIYPITSIDSIGEAILRINYKGSPKVLYIDDEFEKGWEEVFSELIGEKKRNLF
jgi:hypothetical protein